MKYQKLLLFSLALVVLLSVAWFMPVADWLRELLQWSTNNPKTAWLVFIMMYVIVALLMFPAIFLTLAAGAMFGVVAGSLLVSFASLLGALAAFGAGRTIARSQMQRLVNRHPKFAALERAIRKKGFLMVFLIRLSPLFPYVLQNYLFSVSSIRWRDYAVATWLGMLPAIVMYVSIGAAAKNLAAIFNGEAVAGGTGQWLFIAGLLVTMVIIVMITRIAGKALKEETI